MAPQLDERLRQSIAEIHTKVLEMGRFAIAALEASIRAYNDMNQQLAYYVILRDRYIDDLEIELDQLCQEFLVREQPAGKHLRFVYSVIKINNELERIGDYAESIARQLIISSAADSPPKKYPDIDGLANTAIPMLKNALQAFEKRDPEMALSTIELENKVDELRNEKQRELVQLHEANKLSTEVLYSLMIITGRLERVSDQACNICEEVLFMTTGETAKHPQQDTVRVLFIDERDSCRGQLAQAIGKNMDIEDFAFSSAGISPTEVDSHTVEFLKSKGIDISHKKSKHINQILHLDNYEVIVTLCKEAEEAFPPAPTKTARIQWKIKDPSRVDATKKDKDKAFEKTYKYLQENIKDLVQAIKGNQQRKTEES